MLLDSLRKLVIVFINYKKDALANGKKKGGFYLLEHDGKKVWISGFDTWEEGRAAYIAIRGKLKGELRADALKKLLG